MQRVFAGLGLRAPVRPSWVLVLSPAVAVALRAAGDWIAARIPDEGTAPVQALVSMPSGTLAYATVAVLVPFAEELFFRGFVYGTAVRRFGPVSAFVLAAALFSLAHVPQLWGAWGPLASVTLTGIVLTSLRAWSGSVLLPTFTHVAHNAVIVLSVFNPSA
jgi:membrane protease YdiL (CAAX protease family)